VKHDDQPFRRNERKLAKGRSPAFGTGKRAWHFRPLQSGALSSSGAAQMKAVVAEARFDVGEAP
jgi:hypothetical protein